MEVTAPICPECAAGKHPNCDGTAWDHDTDRAALCCCDNAAHVREGLTQTPLQDVLDVTRGEIYALRARIDELILSACPTHELRQHRDRQPPWCEKCRRTADGYLIPQPAEEPVRFPWEPPLTPDQP